MSDTIQCDIAITGGGLAGGLIALALKLRRPDIDVRIIEGEQGLGGNHVWSFFDTDIAPRDWPIVEPLICKRWPAYDVHFPGLSRTLDAPYNAIESEHFDAVVRGALGSDRIVAARAVDVSPTRVLLDNQGVVQAGGVIDARGPGDLSLLRAGWQKFVGQRLRLDRPHGLERPIVMDARVAQGENYRFVYCLPFSETEVFVEDTYYSDSPALDVADLRARIAAYADAQGWQGHAVVREEKGVLPVTIDGDFDAYWASSGGDVAKAGMRSGMFHPTTGYSLPDAVRMASCIADSPVIDGETLHRITRDYATAHWKERGYYRMLDAMLFDAAEPSQRYRVLQRFYGLSPALIRRFYAGQSTLADKVRIMTGKPPLPFWRAVGVFVRRAL